MRLGAWAVSAAMLALVTGIAALHGLRLLRDAWRWPESLGQDGLAIALGYTVGALALLSGAWLLTASPSPRRLRLAAAGAIAATVVIRVAVAAAFDAPLAAENAVIHQQAVEVLDGANCCFSHRPMGYPLALAGAYSLLGIGPMAVESLNVVLATLTALLVFDIGRVGWGARTGVIAATAYAVMPSQVLMVLPPLTEPLYTALVAAAVRMALVPGVPAAAALGLTLAAAQYVRATAAALLAPAIALYASVAPSVRIALVRPALLLAAFILGLLPVVAYNIDHHGEPSISTSAYGGWSLFVGANESSSGRYNAEDAAVFAELPGASAWERSRRAAELAVERILADPAGYLQLQPRKFSVLWRDESYAGSYAFSPAGSAVPRETAVAWILSQIFYVPAVGLATAGVIRDGRARSAALLVGMIVVVMTLSHALLEVHSRYHAYLIPLLLPIAVGALRPRQPDQAPG